MTEYDEKNEWYMQDIPKFIEVLSSVINSDFNEIIANIITGKRYKKMLKLSDTKKKNCMIDIQIEKIKKILFPEDINNVDDIVDNAFLDINLQLLINYIIDGRWKTLLLDEFKENLESLGDCIRANFKKRQEMLKLVPPETHVKLVPNKITRPESPFQIIFTDIICLTTFLNYKSKFKIKRKMIPQRKAVTPKKKAITPQKKAATPKKETITPKKKAATPKKEAITPQKKAMTPQKKAATPKKIVATPKTFELFY